MLLNMNCIGIENLIAFMIPTHVERVNNTGNS